MGAFYFAPKKYDTEQVRAVFTKKGFGRPVEIKTISGVALLYRKQLVDELNYRIIGKSIIFSVGTLFYKNKRYGESLDAILEDFLCGTLELSLIVGSYFIFIENEGQKYYLTDRSGIQNIYFNRNCRVISSSFLAVLVALGEIAGCQTMNSQSICEVLTTGNLIGPDTIVEDIERYEPVIHVNLPGMKRIDCQYDIQIKQNISENCSAEIDRQIHSLSNYFKICETPLNHYGISSGLTGGFDSRLLYLNFKRYSKNYQIYSTYRENQGQEFLCAQKFARAAGENLLTLPHTPPEKMNAAELSKTLSDNFYFNDGLIRTHQLWLEEIKGKEYLKNLYGPFRVGFSGVGGEQYRNGEYLIKNRYSFNSWVRSELLLRVSGLPFLDSESKSIFISKLRTKIAKLLGMPAHSKYISKKEIKRYYNELWNPANRTIRNSIENQLVFFLSPFTDYKVSRTAYNAIQYLGGGPKFEMEMIRRLAPELAACETNYGFSLSGRMSIFMQVLPYLKSVFGLKMFNHLIFLKNNKKQNYYEVLLRKHPELNEHTANVSRLNLPLNFDKLKKNNFLSPLLFETGYFLSEMKKYIKL